MHGSTLKGYSLAALLGSALWASQGALAQTANCDYVVENDWGGGATASIEITNTGNSAISGWQVSWDYTDNEITSSWNANISGSNPYTATDMGWNASIEPGQTVSFGMQLATNGSVETPTVSGALCDGEAPPSSSSSAPTSSAPSSSVSSSATSSSSSSSSETPDNCAATGESCNWYGTQYPLCNTTESGWGWEDQQSCIAPATCSGQPDPYGIEGEGGGSCPPSSSSSSAPSPSSSSRSSSSSSLPDAGECGQGNPQATVTGSPGNYQVNGNSVGSSYVNAINAALDSLSPGRNTQERVAVFADGDIGGNAIDLPSHTVFEVCGTMNAGNSSGNGAVQAIGVQNVSIPFLSMTGSPYFGLRFADVHNLHLGEIDLRLNSGLGIRFERDMPGSTDVRMDHIYVSGTNNHGVETWNLDGLEIGTLIARNTGYAGLLLNNTRNATIGLVDGEGTATGTGYATLRFANENGRIGGGYPTNIYVDRLISRGGGRGFFCVSNSGGAEINQLDLADNGNNSVLIENCHNITINSGQINGGGEFRLAARSEFPNNSDITIADLDVVNTSVRESPCGNNINWINVNVQGGSYNICN